MVPAAMVAATRRMSAQFLPIRSAFTLPPPSVRRYDSTSMSSGPAPLARTGGAGQPLIGVALLQVAGVEVHSLARPNFQRERAVLGSKGFHEHGRLNNTGAGKAGTGR